MTFPKVSFGIIVLNGEPFTRYTLRMLYPFAHEIIVVEGAAPAAANVATPDGHSRDGTLEILRQFKIEEDVDDKLQIVTKDGFWTEKDEMSRAYADRATGDYLWQVDIDEFYMPEDIEQVLQMLQADPAISAVSFKTVTFWGSPYVTADGWFLRRGMEIFHRLFKWGEGYRYATHRPPTVLDETGTDTRAKKYVDGYELAKRGIIMYHASLLFPKQVMEKSEYYKSFPKREREIIWAEEVYKQLKRPFRVHNVYYEISWLNEHTQAIPPHLQQLWLDAQHNQIEIELRDMQDANTLLNSKLYRLQRFILRLADYLLRPLLHLKRQLRRTRLYQVLRNHLRRSAKNQNKEIE